MSTTYPAGAKEPPTNDIPKDPDEVLDYPVDFTSLLQSGETIASYTVEAGTGITVDSDTESSGVVTVWLSGGTHGQKYLVSVEIVTNSSPTRTYERSQYIPVRTR